MPNATVPAAATGLSEETAILAETDRGLAVVRPAGLRALRPTFLSEEEVAALLDRLDAYVAADSLYEHRRETSAKPNDDPNVGKALEETKRARRKLIGLVQKARTVKAKTLDDIMFKALLCEAVDRYDCERSNTLGHSIVNDLLSADCMWRAA